MVSPRVWPYFGCTMSVIWVALVRYFFGADCVAEYGEKYDKFAGSGQFGTRCGQKGRKSAEDRRYAALARKLDIYR